MKVNIYSHLYVPKQKLCEAGHSEMVTGIKYNFKMFPESWWKRTKSTFFHVLYMP